MALVSLALSASAQEAALQLVVERVVVEGTKLGTEAIVVSESRLVAGRAYTESELRQAVYRIERLPFVLAADFSLRKGSARGRFELVITVTEVGRFFVAFEATSEDRETEGVWLGPPVPERQQDTVGGPLVAARHFVGRYLEASLGMGGMSYSEVDGLATDLHLSLTHYNLLGRRIVGTFAARRRVDGWRSGESWLRLGLAVPTGPDRAVRGTVIHARPDRTRCTTVGLPSTCTDDTRLWKAALDWVWNTTDDPFVPRAGHSLSAGVLYDETRSRWRTPAGGQEPWSDADDLVHDTSGLTASAARYLAVGRRSSVGLRAQAEAGWGHHRAIYLSGVVVPPGRVRTVEATAGATHFLLLRPVTSTESFTRWWLESGAAVAHERETFTRLPRIGRDRTDLVPSLGFAGRGRWGTVRFTFAYRTRLGGE